MSLDSEISKVEEFHRLIGAPVCENPTLPNRDRDACQRYASQLLVVRDDMRNTAVDADCAVVQRAAMVLEELAEWLEAAGSDDLVGLADAWADRLFLLLGDALVTGLPAQPLFDEVAASNLTKLPGVANGAKGVKGPGYRPPDIEKVLRANWKPIDRS